MALPELKLDAKPDTRERIVEAAARLFHEQGYNATGISTILREAGVNAGSLYHFFPSKEALLVGVLERYVQGLHPLVIGPVEARTQDPIERVFALLEQYRNWLAPIGFSMGCPIGNLALEIADSAPQVRALIDLNFQNWSKAVRAWIDAAGDRLPAATNRNELADFVLTVMEGGIMQSRAARTPEAFDACVSQLRRYFELLQEAARRERSSAAGPS